MWIGSSRDGLLEPARHRAYPPEMIRWNIQSRGHVCAIGRKLRRPRAMPHRAPDRGQSLSNWTFVQSLGQPYAQRDVGAAESGVVGVAYEAPPPVPPEAIARTTRNRCCGRWCRGRTALWRRLLHPGGDAGTGGSQKVKTQVREGAAGCWCTSILDRGYFHHC